MRKNGFLWMALIALFGLQYFGCHATVRKNYFIKRDKINKIKTIAVLPFYNTTEGINTGTIVANIMMAELINSKRFNVIKYGDIMEFLSEKKLANFSTLDIDTLRLIRKEYKADAVIFGTIYRYDEAKETRGEFLPSVFSISINLVETKSGQILWREDLTATGSTKGYLLDQKDNYLCFSLAKNLLKNVKNEKM